MQASGRRFDPVQLHQTFAPAYLAPGSFGAGVVWRQGVGSRRDCLVFHDCFDRAPGAEDRGGDREEKYFVGLLSRPDLLFVIVKRMDCLNGSLSGSFGIRAVCLRRSGTI